MKKVPKDFTINKWGDLPKLPTNPPFPPVQLTMEDILEEITKDLGGELHYFTCSNSAGRTSKKIVIEYDHEDHRKDN